MSDKQSREQLLGRLVDVGQSVFTELESIGSQVAVLELVVSPTSRQIYVMLQEIDKHTVKKYPASRPLIMKEVSFEEHLNAHLPPGARMRGVDMTNLDPQTIENMLGPNKLPDTSPEVNQT